MFHISHWIEIISITTFVKHNYRVLRIIKSTKKKKNYRNPHNPFKEHCDFTSVTRRDWQRKATISGFVVVCHNNKQRKKSHKQVNNKQTNKHKKTHKKKQRQKPHTHTNCKNQSKQSQHSDVKLLGRSSRKQPKILLIWENFMGRLGQ